MEGVLARVSDSILRWNECAIASTLRTKELSVCPARKSGGKAPLEEDSFGFCEGDGGRVFMTARNWGRNGKGAIDRDGVIPRA
jgi:hypothetical protein